MKRNEKLLIVLIVLTLAFIWGNSLLNADQSSAMSSFVRDLVQKLFPGLLSIDAEESSHLIRKLAHGTEYLLLGAELSLLLFRFRGRPLSLPLLLGTLAALFDETIQLFSAGRGSAVKDVWIDLGGFLVGALLGILIDFIIKKARPSGQSHKCEDK